MKKSADSGDNLIHSYSERMLKKTQNEQTILRFLKDEKFSTAEILSKLLGFKMVSPIYSTLNRMVKNGVLSTYPITHFFIQTVNLYGITQQGITRSLNDNDNPFRIRPFEPSKINLNTLRHRLDIQRISIEANKQGYNWCSLNNIKLNKGAKYPDGLMRKDGIVYAIEVEKTPKSPRRYKEIIEQYINQMSVSGWKKIIYLFPDEQMRDRVKKIFLSVNSIMIYGNLRPLTTENINSIFVFLTYDNFKSQGID